MAACAPRWGAARSAVERRRRCVSIGEALAEARGQGHVVTARITAHQTDGTVGTYQGTYTVHNGVIVGFDVLQVG